MSDTKKPNQPGPQLRRPVPPLNVEKPAPAPEVKEPVVAASVPEPVEPETVVPAEPSPELAPPVAAATEPKKEVAKEVSVPPRRSTVTAEGIETQIEKLALQHLHTVQKFPTGTCTLRDFRKGLENVDAAQAQQMVSGYVLNGLLAKSWRAAAGRYSLTEAGVEKYNELVEKYGSPE